MNKYVEALKDVAAMNQGLGALHGVYSIVAGGAARDVDFRKPFKDIDIFVVMDTDDDRKVVQVQDYYEQFFQFGDIIDPDNPYEENLKNLVSVENHSFNRYDTVFPVQIIFQKSQNTGNPLKEITDQFDLGACQIAFKCEGDGQYKMVKSEQYKQDKADEKVRLSQFGLALPTPERRRKTRARAERIANKLDLRFESMWPGDVQARQRQAVDFEQMLIAQRAMLNHLYGNRPVVRAVHDIQPAVYYNPINGGR